MQAKTTGKTTKGNIRHNALTIVGGILCAIFGFILICNLTIIIKGALHPEEPPSVIGMTPLVVLSGSMMGEAEDSIDVGDMVIVDKVEAELLKVGDIIAFMDGETIITHRIQEIQMGENGEIQWITKGDANNAIDKNAVTEDEIVGIYKFKIPKIGNFVLFMQTPLGMAIFIGGPLLIFLLCDSIMRRKQHIKDNEKTEKLTAEIRKLRQMVDEKEAGVSENQ